MLRLLSIISSIIICGQLSAQDLFEHLSHKDGHGAVVSFLPTEEGIFYHDNSPVTKIKFVSYENEVNVLWANTKYNSFWSEFHRLEGNDWILFMSQIVDYDLILSELWVFKYIDGQLTQQVFEYYDEGFYLDSVTDILYKNDNSILLVTNDRLIELDINGEIVNSVPNTNGYGCLINENQFGEKYLSTFQGKIFSIDSNLSFLLKNDSGFNITNMSSLGDNKTMIGNEDKIIVYNSDCTDVISSIDSPSGGLIKSIVSLPDYNSYVLEVINDQYLVWHLNPEGEFILLHREECEALWYNKIALFGDHVFEFGQKDYKISHFKSFSLDPFYDDGVERPQVLLDDFQVFLKDVYTVYDTTPNFIAESNFKDYYYEFQWTNAGSKDINCYDLFISYIPSGIMPTLGKKESFNGTLIAPGETVNLDGWITINADFATWNNPNYQPDELTIPGANNLPICQDYYIVDDLVLNTESADIIHEQVFKVFPNPSTSIVNIEGINPNEVLRMFDVYGNLVWFGSSSSKVKRIDVSTFENGIYFIMNDSTSHSFIKN